MQTRQSYARRLLLIAAPTLDPAELARVTLCRSRRMALFLAFTAVVKSQSGRKTKAPLLRRLVVATGGVDVLRYLGCIRQCSHFLLPHPHSLHSHHPNNQNLF